MASFLSRGNCEALKQWARHPDNLFKFFVDVQDHRVVIRINDNEYISMALIESLTLPELHSFDGR